MRLNQSKPSSKNQHLLPFTLALVLVLCGFNTQANSSASESTNLELILRQLDAIDRIARASEALPVQDGARYYFDYARLASEVELMRQGIRAYQTPIRAQPRQAPELTGHYLRQEKRAP